jgi:fibronectin type 3 domain-containing protein
LEMKSSRSNAVTLAMRDTFPPSAPTGLDTISGAAPASTAAAYAGPYVDLSWEPNSEPDLAGYRVYRQLARPDGSPQGPLARLTALPIAVPAYRDVAVKAGQGYIYSVTAVDAAGNESAPSAKALEVVSEAASPGSGEPPH